jgi:signal transduction histidine kinase
MPSGTTSSSAEPVRTLRLLLLTADDDEAAQVMEAVRCAGYEPAGTWVDNQIDYLSRLADDPEIVLAAWQLPQYDALRALEAVRERRLEIPVLIISAPPGEEMAVEAMQAGAADYLLKGRLARLGQSIGRALERRREDDRRRSARSAPHDSEEGFHVAATHAAMRDLSARLQRAQDEERRRFARELHDCTAQSLTAISLSLTLLSTVPGVESLPEAQKTIQECERMVGDCIRDVRRISYVLHPALLDELGLETAIRNYLPDFQRRSGIAVRFGGSTAARRFPPHLETLAFRFMQEALSNAERHGHARTVEVRLLEGGGRLTLAVEDDGCDFSQDPGDPETAGALTGVGLAAFRERARHLGGDIRIHSTPAGSTVQLSVPIGEA